MIKYSCLLLILIIISCNQGTNEQPDFSEELLSDNDVNMKLIPLNNGAFFEPNDSMQYINLFLLNDSTIQVEDSISKLEKDTGEDCFMCPYRTERINPNQSTVYTARTAVNSISSGNNRAKEINIYVDSSVRYRLIGSLYAHLFDLRLADVNSINFFGKGNQFIPIRYTIIPKQPRPPGTRSSRDILDILVNKKMEIMIEGDLGKGFEDVNSEALTYYIGDEESNLITIDKSTCKSQIALLQQIIEEGDTSKINRLNRWKRMYKQVEVFGTYITLSQYDFILLQFDNIVPAHVYYQAIDSILKATNTYRLLYLKETFGEHKNFTNTGSDTLQLLNEICPNRINPKIYYPPELIPPPPVVIEVVE